MSTETPTPSESGPAAPEPAPAAGAVELPFQAEVQQVLSLVINSLYTHKEVFLRELVSNASDALDKARFLQLTRKDVAEQVGEARISITLDDDARTLTIDDNGIGMTRDEVVQNLGTIARSGSLEFLKSHAEAAKQGLGAPAHRPVRRRLLRRVHGRLARRRAHALHAPGRRGRDLALRRRRHLHRHPRASASTPARRIVLHLKEDAREYAKAWRGQGHHPQVLRLRPLPHLRERRAGQPLARAVGTAEIAGHRGAARRALPPRHRRGRGGDADAHRPLVGGRARAVSCPPLRARARRPSTSSRRTARGRASTPSASSSWRTATS